MWKYITSRLALTPAKNISRQYTGIHALWPFSGQHTVQDLVLDLIPLGWHCSRLLAYVWMSSTKINEPSQWNKLNLLSRRIRAGRECYLGVCPCK